MMDDFRLPVITGLTASGKTEIAQQFIDLSNSIVISIDSRKLYKFMDIGTAKPKKIYWKNYRMINIILPSETYNLGLYFRNAQNEIKKALDENRKVILEGGTVLYLKSLIEGISIFPQPNEQLLDFLNSKETNELYNMLSKLDSYRAQQVNKNDRFRIIRSLAVILTTGMSYQKACQEFFQKPSFKYDVFILEISKDELKRNIEKRIYNMLNDGLIEEIKSIISNFGENAIALRKTIDYYEFIDYINGKIALREAIFKCISDTYEFAKRQRNFLRKIDGKTITKQEAINLLRSYFL